MLTMQSKASSTRTFTEWAGETTNVRTADRYAAIEVTTMFRLVGSRIGPPALKE